MRSEILLLAACVALGGCGASAGPRAAVERDVAAGGGALRFALDPAVLGDENRVEVRLAGPPRTVTVAFEMPEMPMGARPVPLAPEGGGLYAARVPFTMAGRWRAEIRVDGGAPGAVAFDVRAR